MAELKGHDFPDDSPFIPTALRPGGRAHTPERLRAYQDQQRERWKIVSICKACGRELVAEEVDPHRLNHVPERLRAYARDLAALTPDDRLELFRVFNRRTGALLEIEG